MAKPYALLPFAVYFDELIKRKGQSSKAFADSVDINERLIRAWRSGERIPNFPNLEALRQVLDLPFDEVKDKLVESMQKKGERKSSTKPSSPLLAIDEVVPSSNLSIQSRSTKVTSDKSKLNQSLIHLVQSLGEPRDQQHNRILITFQSRDVVFEKEFVEEWKSSLKNTIQNGWFIEHIIQIDRARERNLRTISNILRYMSNEDQYQLYKLKHKKLVDVSSGMLIIPGVGAIVCYATQHPDCIDKGISFKSGADDNQIQICAEHFELIKQQSDSVFKKYDNTKQQEALQEALEELAQTDHHAGERIVFLKRLSEVIRPLSFYDKDSNWAKAIQKYYNFTDQQLDKYLETRKKRHEAFRNTLRNDRCRYIYYLKTLNEFISTGTTYPYYFHATEQERLDQLLEIRRLILSEDSNKNFEFALIHEDEEAILGDVKTSFCEVKKGLVTTMEVPTGTVDENGNLQHKWFVIEDVTVTNAVADYFSDIWDLLKDDSKGLSALLWLNQQINTLEDLLGLPRTGGG
jgi:transcriptional regulator with XRE-family HTH domain